MLYQNYILNTMHLNTTQNLFLFLISCFRFRLKIIRDFCQKWHKHSKPLSNKHSIKQNLTTVTPILPDGLCTFMIITPINLFGF